MAQISADEAVLFRFEQRILIHPEGEASFVHQPFKICAICEICGFNRGHQIKGVSSRPVNRLLIGKNQRARNPARR